MLALAGLNRTCSSSKRSPKLKSANLLCYSSKYVAINKFSRIFSPSSFSKVEDLIKHNEALSSQALEFQQKYISSQIFASSFMYMTAEVALIIALRYQQVSSTLASSSDSMRKFAKDMTKQQQLYVSAVTFCGFASRPVGTLMQSSRIRCCARRARLLRSVWLCSRKKSSKKLLRLRKRMQCCRLFARSCTRRRRL